LPEFRDWSIAAVRLLQGVVEANDGRAWNLLLSNQSQLEGYFARLGLRLVVDEPEGLAYLRQLAEDESPPGYDSLPKLFRATRLSYGQTLLCVLLRDAFRRFEEEDVRNERCVVEETALLEQWRAYFPQHDDVKRLRDLQACLKRLEEFGFVKRFGQEAASWEVRRLLKARVTADELEHLQRRMSEAVARGAGAVPTHESSEDES
jgi:hypothetical protein